MNDRPSGAAALDTAAHWLTPIYGAADTEGLLRAAAEAARRHGLDGDDGRGLDQRFSLLITYGDIVQRPGQAPLATLHDFLRERLGDSVSAVHVLPFYPHSSDDGFSVIDYRAVDRDLGDWSDIRALARDYDLMFDLVLNHVSRKSQWFANYLGDADPGRDYFIEVDPAADLRAVVRPRSTPLLAEVPTARGTRHLWATFSEDQIDLDFRNPAVLREFIDIILGYVAAGARLLRLDAVAFIWKAPGTSCIHLEPTHHLIKALRALLSVYAPGVRLVTETNVPHRENISYLTDGDEAHIAYQFALPPLILHTLLGGDCAALRDWAAGLPALPPGCHFLNFTASHDGIGLRAVEEILAPAEIGALVDAAHERGGFVSTRADGEGSHHPYELNVSYFSVLGGDRHHIARFLCSQAISLALRGLPALYFHSLTATGNALARVEASGRYRTINRRKWDAAELERLLDRRDTAQAQVFAALRHLLEVRGRQPALHPEAAQTVVDIGTGVFAVERRAPGQTLVALHNVTDREQAVSTAILPEANRWRDLVAGRAHPASVRELRLAPYQVAWLSD